jgi:hypothetical protein
VSIIVDNTTTDTIFVLKEPWSRGIWVDALTKRLVVMHAAFDPDRELKIRGGATYVGAFDPKFYKLEPGRSAKLEWRVKLPSPGDWSLEGDVSVLFGLPNLNGLEMTQRIKALSGIDTTLSLPSKTLVIELDGKHLKLVASH